MNSVYLNANLREQSGRGPSHRLRKSHSIPGVVYGGNADNLLVEFSEMDLNDVIRSYGEHAFIDLEVNGRNMKAMIVEVQREPVNRNLIHVDMKNIRDDEIIHTQIPVIIKGEDMIRSKGGVVQKLMGTVTVEATPEKLPKCLIADISHLDIGGKLTTGDIELSSDISILSDLHSVLATVLDAKDTNIGKENPETSDISISLYTDSTNE
jgi:large subunit ribosomal protein L25